MTDSSVAAPAEPWTARRVFITVVGLHRRVHIGRSWHALPYAAIGAAVAKRGLPTLGEATLLSLCVMFGRALVVAVHRALGAPEEVANPGAADEAERIGDGGDTAGPTPRVIWWVFAFHAALVLGIAAWFISPLAGELSIALSFILLFAALLRRRTAWSHVLLGAGLAAAPVGSYVAMRGEIDAGVFGPAFLSAGVLAWAVGFDVLWSLQPRLRAPGATGGFPVPMAVTVRQARVIARVLQFVALAFFCSARRPLGLGAGYFLGMAGATYCVFAAHWRQRAKDAADVGGSFLRFNLAVGPCLFAGCVAGLMT